MRKFAVITTCLLLMGACSEHDPILPGVRVPVFETGDVSVMGRDIDNLPDVAFSMPDVECPYTRDSANVIWDGERKIFTGFPTSNSVAGGANPVCYNGYVYAGLTTGEVVKVAPNSRQVAWIADVFRPSNMTGGASVVDIVAPLVIKDGAVYAGGVGDAFCRINAISGEKSWCTKIGTAMPFIIAGDAIFVVATDGYLYALRTSDGAVYWRTEIEQQKSPSYENKIITVGRQKFNAVNGEIIK